MKTKYGKIVCGALRVPQNYPDYIEDASGKKIVNPTDEQMAAAGYLPIVTKKPATRAGKVAVPSYALNADKTKIVQSWNYEPEPDQQPTDESN